MTPMKEIKAFRIHDIYERNLILRDKAITKIWDKWLGVLKSTQTI